MSFSLIEGEAAAELEARGFQGGIGNCRIHCGDYIPSFFWVGGAEENCGFIYEVGVAPPAVRGNGLGSALVEYAMEWMRDRGCKGGVGRFKNDRDNEARERFWTRLGFALMRNSDGKVIWIKRSFD